MSAQPNLAGQQIDSAADDEAAFVNLQRQGFDGVEFDLGLPTMDGLEVNTRRLHRQPDNPTTRA